nr:retrovirus-related Pol polyprotein [Tanacetum cinerariifolium]
MSTRSSGRNLFPPLDNPELTIRRRSHIDHTLLNDFEMATEGNGDPPVPDLQTMEELCQPSLNGRGGPIAPIAIQATNFRLKNDMIQQVHNSCQFHGLPGDDANKHLDKFLHVTQSIKVNGVTDDALRVYLFPHSLTHHATTWFDRLPRNSINTFEQMAKMFLGKYFPPSMVAKLKNEITNFHTVYNGLTLRHRDTINAAAGGTFMKRHPEECYDLIKNMTAHHNDWDNSTQWSESSSSITSFSDLEIAALKAKMAKINKNIMSSLVTVGQTQNVYDAGAYQGGIPQGNNQRRNQFFQGASHGQNPPPSYQASAYQAPGYQPLVHQPPIPQPQVVTTAEFTNYMKENDAILKNMQTNMTSLTNSNPELKNMFGQFMNMNTASSSGLGTLPGNTITNPKEDMKGIITQSGTAYQGPTIPTTSSSFPQVVERETEVTKDMVPPTNNGSTKDVQPLIVQTETLVPNFKPVVAPIIKSVVAPTERALIDVFKEELTLCVGKEAITFNLDQTSRYSANYNDMTANRIDVIDMACEDYSQEVLGFSDVITIDAFLALEDDPTSPEVDHFYFDPEGEILLLEAFLNDDTSLPPPTQGNYVPQVRKELKIYEAKTDKSSIDEPPEVELKNLPPHLEYVFLEGDDKLPVIIAKDLSEEEKTALIKVLKSHKQAIAWKLSDIKGINLEFYTHKILMEDDFEPAVQQQRRVNPKIYDVITKEVLKLLDARLIYPISDSPWDEMLERLVGNEYYCFLDGFSGYFQIPIDQKDQEKTTFTCPYGTFAYHHMPFGLCNAPGMFERCMMAIFHDMIEKTMEVFMEDFSEKSHFLVKEGIFLGHKISKNGIEVDKAKVYVIAKLPYPTTVKGVVLGQRQEKHFRPIHYASKILIEAELNYTTTKKDMLAVVYAFEKFRSYLIMNKIIVYTDHSALKYLFAKKDSKARLLRWILLLQEFKFKVIDTKGAKNLAADHLSRLENPHQNVLNPKEINETFPLETLNMVFFVSSGGVFTARKLLTFSRLATMDLPGDIMARTTLPRRCLTLDSIGPLSTVMPTTWSNLVTLVNVRERFHNEMKMPQNSIQVCEIFYVWGIDFMGPFPSLRGNKYILVAVDYLLKWVEAKALPTNDARVVCKFLKSLFARFGTPCSILSDRGTHFYNDPFAKVMLKYDVTHHLATAYHPRTSGQVEVSNHGLKSILERTVGEKRASWSDKLDDALWAFRTAYKTPIGCTSYKLVYGKACHLPIELEHKAYWALKHKNFDL